MAFVATLDRIDKVKNVEDEMMNYVKFKAAMEKRDWDEELKEQSDAKINAPSLNVIKRYF